MESPPVFNPMPPAAPKRSNTVLIVVLSVLGLCAICCISLIFMGKSFWDKAKGSIECMTHYPVVRKAIKEYAVDHGGKLPDAKNWQDEIAPYYKKIVDKDASSKAFIDLGDANADLGCKAQDGAPATGIAYNDDLSGVTLAKAEEDGTKVILFEVPTTGRNLHMKFKTQKGQSPQKLMGQPREWITLEVRGSMNGQASTNVGDPDMNGL